MSKKVENGNINDERYSLEVERSLESHGDTVNTVVYFGSPINRLASCSDDYTIRIWDTKRGKNEKTLDCHTEWVNFCVKWDKESFLSCGLRIYRISVIDMEVTDHIITLPKTAYKILKINDDQFLATYSNILALISFSEKRIIKKLNIESFYSYSTTITLSSRYDDCFYINYSKAATKGIILYDLKKDKSRLDIPGIKMNSFCVWKDHETKKEILVFGGTDKKLNFYKLGGKGFKIMTTDQKFDDAVTSIRCMKNKILLVGNVKGDVFLYDIRNLKLIKKLCMKKELHESWIYDFKMIGYDIMEKKLTVASCSADSTVKIFSVNGILLELSEFGRFEEEDLKERILFFRDEVELYNFKGKGNHCCFSDFFFRNVKFFNIHKILL